MFAFPCAISFASALTDIKSGKIYNKIIIPGFFLGLLYCLAEGGVYGLTAGLLRSLMFFAVMFPLYYFVKGLGAGDVKLFMALAPYLTFDECVSLTVLSFFLAGGIAVAKLIIKRFRARTIHFALPVFLGLIIIMGGRLW